MESGLVFTKVPPKKRQQSSSALSALLQSPAAPPRALAQAGKAEDDGKAPPLARVDSRTSGRPSGTVSGRASANPSELDGSNGLPFSLTLFLSPKVSVRITLTEACSLATLTRQVLHNCVDPDGTKLPLGNVDGYSVLAASDNGEIDEEVPVLDTKRWVHSFGLSHLALVPELAIHWRTNEAEMFVGPRPAQGGETVDLDRAMISAAEKGDVGLVKKYLKDGADVNARGIDNWTALHFACRKGYFPIVNILFKADANLDAVTKNGWTPLHHACFQGHVDLVDILVTWGADQDIKDNDGRPALFYAREKGFKDIEDLLMGQDDDD